MSHVVGLVMLLAAQAVGVHTTHYPRHGGQFFTAINDTLHVEATWPAQRLVQVYVSAVDGQPVGIARLKRITGRVVAGGVTVPLRFRAEGFLEARVPTLKEPAEMLVEISESGAGGGLNMVFAEHSDERALSFALAPTVIPDTLALTLAALRKDVADVDDLVKQQEVAYAFAPAVRARDHALSLERFLPSDREARAIAEAKIREAVRIAWLLHIEVDDGSAEQVTAALAELRRIVAELPTVFGGPQ